MTCLQKMHQKVLDQSAAADAMLLMERSEIPEHRNMMPVLGLVPSVRGLAGAFVWGFGDTLG